jgi:universal stress protein A
MKVKPAEKPGRVVVELDPLDENLLASSERTVKASMPFKIQNILVPIDFSECSKKALQYAIPFAKQFRASLTLIHVVQINYGYGEFAAIDYALLEKQIREGSEKQLTDLAETEIGNDVSAKVVVGTGVPAREIVDTARIQNSDLIIISTHGRTGLKHVIVGSTAENVVRHAPCPVLVVREHEHEFITTSKP